MHNPDTAMNPTAHSAQATAEAGSTTRKAGAAETDCDECGAAIPDSAASGINNHHLQSCSCYPDL